MPEAEIIEGIKKILVGQLGGETEKITLDFKLSDLGADSLDVVEMILGIEEHFNIEIPEGTENHMTTVNDMVDYVTRNYKTETNEGYATKTKT